MFTLTVTRIFEIARQIAPYFVQLDLRDFTFDEAAVDYNAVNGVLNLREFVRCIGVICQLVSNNSCAVNILNDVALTTIAIGFCYFKLIRLAV